MTEPRQAPTYRPAWLTVLTSSMLVYGGVTLVSALLMLREPRAMAVMAIENMARPAESTAEATEMVQKLEALSNAIVERHKAEVRAGALIALGVALLTLYTVAALLSRDPHGRKLAMVTGRRRDRLPARRPAARRGDGPAGGHRGGRAPLAGHDRERAGASRLHGGPASLTSMVVPAILAGVLGALACLVLLYLLRRPPGPRALRPRFAPPGPALSGGRPRGASGGRVPACSPSRLGRPWRLG